MRLKALSVLVALFAPACGGGGSGGGDGGGGGGGGGGPTTLFAESFDNGLGGWSGNAPVSIDASDGSPAPCCAVAPTASGQHFPNVDPFSDQFGLTYAFSLKGETRINIIRDGSILARVEMGDGTSPGSAFVNYTANGSFHQELSSDSTFLSQWQRFSFTLETSGNARWRRNGVVKHTVSIPFITETIISISPSPFAGAVGKIDEIVVTRP